MEFQPVQVMIVKPNQHRQLLHRTDGLVSLTIMGETTRATRNDPF
jgi:hypothetical protein